MRNRLVNGRVFIIMAFCVVLLMALPPSVYAEVTRFKQWIAPLECTESSIVDGENVTTILSPEACEYLLHPKPPDNGGGQPGTHHPTPDVPGAPRTGFFRDPLIGFSIFLLFMTITWLIIMYGRHQSRRDLSKRDFFDKINGRVSSFWTHKTK